MKVFVYSLLIFFGFLSWRLHASAADVYVAYNMTNTSPITEKQIVQILKAESTTWQNGQAIFLYINELKTIETESLNDVIGMNKNDFLQFWRIKLFSGRAFMPKQIADEVVALKNISENPNSIYISIDKKIDSKDIQNIKLASFKF